MLSQVIAKKHRECFFETQCTVADLSGCYLLEISSWWLMKLRLSWRDLDLAERFAVSCATVSNVHEFFDGVMIAVGIPSQQRCRESMPKSFEDFVSASFFMDCTEISQDIPADLNKQSLAYSNYISKHTVNALTCCSKWSHCLLFRNYPGSTSDVHVRIVAESSVVAVNRWWSYF